MAKISILGALVIMLFLAGCQGDSDATQPAVDDQPQEEPTGQEPIDEQQPTEQEPIDEQQPIEQEPIE